MNIETRAKLASTRLLQLRGTVNRRRDVVVCVQAGDPVYKGPYDCICVGEEATRRQVGADETPVAAYWLAGGDTEGLKFLIATPDGLDSDQSLAMNDFGSLYPHLGDWEGTAADAVNKLATLLGYSRVVPSGATAPEFHLIVQLYKPPVRRRWRELMAAFRRNVANPLITRVHVICESDGLEEAWRGLDTEKLTFTTDAERLSYRRFRDYVQVANIPADAFVCLANADIYFDETLRDVWNCQMERVCLALLRYEATLEFAEKGSGTNSSLKSELPNPSDLKLFGPRDDSQDCWIFRRADLMKADESWAALTFKIGEAGCDNAFAGELVRRRWLLANPCNSIRAIHVHESAYRTYRPDDRVSGGIYATIAPSGVVERPLLGPDAFKVAAKDTISAPTKYVVSAAATEAGRKGMDTLYKTVMPAKIVAEGSGEPAAATLRVLEAPAGAVITEDGLVAFGGGIGFSATDDASELAWAQTKYDALTPLVPIQRGVFVPGRSQVAGDELLRIGLALWIRERVGDGCPLVMPSEYERLFAGLLRGTGLDLRRLGSAAARSSEPAVGLLPTLNTSWHAAAVQTLKSVIGQRLQAGESEYVLIGYGADEAQALEDMWDSGSVVACFENLNANPAAVLTAVRGARVVVGCRGALGYIWAMKQGSVYIDTEPCAVSAAMATLCGVKYVPLTFKDESAATFARCVLESSSKGSGDVSDVAVPETL